MIEDTDDFKQALAEILKEKPDEAEVAKYRATKLPELIKFSKGEPSRARFEQTERAKLEEEGSYKYSMRGLKLGFMIFWIFSSIQSAYKIPRGKGV